jgi:hypothetical protein
MNSRIGNHIEFPNYEADELVEIGLVMCRELEYTLDAGAIEALRAYMTKRMTMPFFSNARTVRVHGDPSCRDAREGRLTAASAASAAARPSWSIAVTVL